MSACQEHIVIETVDYIHKHACIACSVYKFLNARREYMFSKTNIDVSFPFLCA
jgi:hypothetical protein